MPTDPEPWLQPIGPIPCTREQRQRFREGDLREEWAARYPALFDEVDLRQARNQVQFNFHEWLGAIVLLHTCGYESLQGGYTMSTHPRKREVFRRLTADHGEFFERRDHPAQFPDLFVYSSVSGDWFLCEVKGPRDRLRPNQRELFARTYERTGRQIRVLRFREVAPCRP
jgi:hypothetical protein